MKTSTLASLQPTLECGGQSVGTSAAATSRVDSHCSDLEGSTMVPGAARDEQRLPTNRTREVRSHPTNASTINAGCAPPTSRVEYLRRQYKERQLSEKATELMLASKTYESQFQKWVSWCSTLSVDPISCPIGEVVNFLADLFEQGYQYRSLNAYR